MEETEKWRRELKGNNVLKALRKNGFKAVLVPSIEKAISIVLDLTPVHALVGIGGSVTLREMDLPEILRNRGNKVADHWEAKERGATAEEILQIRKLHLNSDVFITSTNAITETGELVNVDGSGQRVAAMIFGPKEVIVIAGINKVVKSLKEGFERVRNVAAPLNVKRLNRKAPCFFTGSCSNCDSNERICNVTSIIHRRPRNTDITIILIDENLGY